MGFDNDPLLPVCIFIMVGGLIGIYILLRNVKTNIVWWEQRGSGIVWHA